MGAVVGDLTSILTGASQLCISYLRDALMSIVSLQARFDHIRAIMMDIEYMTERLLVLFESFRLVITVIDIFNVIELVVV